ncbi:hypothetical protein [Polaromonas sp. JS666]|uniref:hypothetical protein n=1 Tax=Polaromonas sp. (strain JS666 / ATCC BAA-500) TaxID=296591 RepID=UPI0002EB9BDD|nr:hypothetical protein [Polaromonas sp. JS666]
MNAEHMNRFLILLLPVLVAGCRLDFTPPVNEKVHLSVYEGKRSIQEREFENTAPSVQAVRRWLAANPEGWEYAFITRDPHIYLAGKNFSVNIVQNEVSVKYCRASYNCHFWVKQDGTLFPEMKNLTQAR